MGRDCIKCGTSLEIGINWTESRKKKRHYICKECFNRAFKERKAYKAERKTNRQYLKLGKKLSNKVTNFIQDSVKRNKELEYSFAEIAEIMQKPCEYCGSSKKYSGLDRVDSSLGYIKGNVVPACAPCNLGKHVMSVQQYIAHCKKVIAHQEIQWDK